MAGSGGGGRQHDKPVRNVSVAVGDEQDDKGPARAPQNSKLGQLGRACAVPCYNSSSSSSSPSDSFSMAALIMPVSALLALKLSASSSCCCARSRSPRRLYCRPICNATAVQYRQAHGRCHKAELSVTNATDGKRNRKGLGQGKVLDCLEPPAGSPQQDVAGSTDTLRAQLPAATQNGASISKGTELDLMECGQGQEGRGFMATDEGLGFKKEGKRLAKAYSLGFRVQGRGQTGLEEAYGVGFRVQGQGQTGLEEAYGAGFRVQGRGQTGLEEAYGVGVQGQGQTGLAEAYGVGFRVQGRGQTGLEEAYGVGFRVQGRGQTGLEQLQECSTASQHATAAVWTLGRMFGFGPWVACLALGLGSHVWLWALGRMFGFGPWVACLAVGLAALAA
eukprot:364954-Chlamydomonas_euryale.AAC.4